MTTQEATVYDDRQDPTGSVGIIDQISMSLRQADLEVSSPLYEEALDLARGGLLGAARDRLRMLLCLDPENGDARLLLAKVFVGQHRWADALSQMDAARALGMQVPASLQSKVEAGLELERNASEVQNKRTATREQAELKALRSEARRLRTENTRMVRDSKQLKSRVTMWSASSAVLAGVSIVLLVFMWALPGEEPAVASAKEVLPAPVVADVELPEPVVEVEAEQPQLAPEEVAELVPPVVEAPAPQAPKEGPAVHTVVSGDTLYEIARTYYGDPTKWKSIKDANSKKLGRRNRLALGMKLTIP